jgi:hypothetical protein
MDIVTENVKISNLQKKSERSLIGPLKPCDCGCGQMTGLIPKTSPRYGHVLGHSYRFISGHHNRNNELHLALSQPRLCACGCGIPTLPAKKTRRGHIKGKYALYVTGHSRKNNPPDAEWLWAQVDRSGGSNACWLWVHTKSPAGYGHISLRGKLWLTHRLAWELTNGPIPDGMFVCHNCPDGDNPSCINPAHLFLGTAQDNMRDMVAKKRCVYGERHHATKLTQAQVDHLRETYAAGGITYKALAKEYGVDKTTVSNIVRYKTWFVTDNGPKLPRRLRAG